MTDAQQIPQPFHLHGWFHAREGWYFMRANTTHPLDANVGMVCIAKTTDGREPKYGEGNLEAYVQLDAATWASIVAGVSARGETAETFAEAERFHRQPHDGQ